MRIFLSFAYVGIVLCLALPERVAHGDPRQTSAPCSTVAALEPRRFEKNVALIDTSGSALVAVLSQGRRWLAPGSYHLQAHGVRLGDLVLTVSHALHPLVVETGSNAGDGTGAFNPLAGIKTTSVRITIDGEGATAHVVYDNPALDLAILRAEPSRAERAREGARALPSIEFAREIVTPKVGDCLVMLATRVHNGVRRLEAFPGHVAFEHAHSDQINTVAALQVNTFTTTLHVLHGDSGAPVLLLRDRARPIIIGVASATRWPAEPFGYVNTVRGILPVLDALTNGSLP